MAKKRKQKGKVRTPTDPVVRILRQKFRKSAETEKSLRSLGTILRRGIFSLIPRAKDS